MSRTGIFGGSFNPIHVAHLIMAERAVGERRLDRVLFIPAGQPPHKPRAPVACAEHRLCMVELAIAGNRAFEVSRIELDGVGPSYTLSTVRVLRRQMPDDELFLMLGGDSLRDVGAWWRADELVQEIDIIAFDRPGAALDEALAGLADRFGQVWAERTARLRVEAPLLDISATEIRRRVRKGLSIRYLVPEAVRQHILDHGLYVDEPLNGDQ